MDVGGRIEKLRGEAGLSQRDLSGLAGIPEAALRRIETEGTGARVDYVVCIAWALGCPVEAILDENPVRERVLVSSNADTSTPAAAAVKQRLTQFLEMDAYLSRHGIGG